MTTISPSVEDENISSLKLFQDRRAIRQQIRPLIMERWHWQYLRRYYQKHKIKLLIFASVLLFQVLLEISLPAYSHLMVRSFNALLDRQLVKWHFAFLITGATGYLFLTYYVLRLEKGIIVWLINNLREHWFKVALYRQIAKATSFEKARLIAKVTYHFSLLQMGLSVTLSGLFRWLINYLVLIAFSFLVSPLLLTYVLLSLPFSFLLLAIGYYIGKYYLSREASLSTSIITHIVTSLDRVAVIQSQAQEESTLTELAKIVELDTALKIRRTLWLEYGYRIIFIGLILIGATVSLAVLLFPGFDYQQFIPANSLTTSLILLYLARQFYLSLRIGLYLVPTKIGLVLSLPEPESPHLRTDVLGNFKEIKFFSRKVKLVTSGQYLKNLDLRFMVGERYLFNSLGGLDLKNLANVLSGQATHSGKPWLVRLDGKRFRYATWRRLSRQARLVNIRPLSSATLAEIISGKTSLEINAEIIKELLDLITLSPLSFISQLPRNISTIEDQSTLSLVEGVLIQLASCLYSKPNLVVIDAEVLDISDLRITQMIKILDQQLTNSVIIIFSYKPVDFLNFNQKYEIQTDALVLQ